MAAGCKVLRGKNIQSSAEVGFPLLTEIKFASDMCSRLTYKRYLYACANKSHVSFECLCIIGHLPDIP